MRKSGATLVKAKIDTLYHSSRLKRAKNVVFSSENNVYSVQPNTLNISNLVQTYRKEIKKRQEKYMQVMGRKVPKNTALLRELILVLDQHTINRESMEKVVQFLKKKYGWDTLFWSIHTDEGNTKTGVRNYHAHLYFYGLKADGMSAVHNWKKSDMSRLQTEVANVLGMQRGKVWSGKKHKDPVKYKADLDKKNVIEKRKGLKELREIKQEIIAKYKEQKNYFESYQKFFESYNDVIKQVKAGTLTIDEAKSIVQDIAGMYSRGILDRLNVLQLSKIMQYGAIAVANLRADVPTQDAIVKEIERGENMSLNMIDKTLRSIIYFVKNKGIMPEINTTQQEEVSR